MHCVAELEPSRRLVLETSGQEVVKCELAPTRRALFDEKKTVRRVQERSRSETKACLERAVLF